MSRTVGSFELEKIKYFFIYNGTVCYATRKIFDSSDEAWDFYVLNGLESLESECSCKKEDKKIYNVELNSNYGGGTSWHADVCMNCKNIVNNLNEHEAFENKENNFW